MPIEHREAAALLVAYSRLVQTAFTDVAVAVRIDVGFPRFVAWARDKRSPLEPHQTQTAIVELLQAVSTRHFPGISEIYCTYAPTSACIGMMINFGVKRAFFRNAGQLVCLNLGLRPAPNAGQAIPVLLTTRPPAPQRLHPALSDMPVGFLNVGKANAGFYADGWLDWQKLDTSENPPI
jgi:hypothetical protein